MAAQSSSAPPRMAPERPFPSYAYRPGHTPHPTRDPEGHSYGDQATTPEPPDPNNWRSCGDYLYGIDLFNHGYYWEAHEAWEGLWVACGRAGPAGTYLQALINLAAAGFKSRMGSARGMSANAATALRLLQSFEAQREHHRGCYMGLDTGALADFASKLSILPPGDDGPPRFDLVMRPE